MKVFIMRGLPGSGKSTWAQKQGGHIISADTYHTIKGDYKYDPALAGDAHNWCLRTFADHVSCQTDEQRTIILDNTNTTVWEIAPYYRLAEAFGAEVAIIRIHCDPMIAARRNIHGVPVKTIFAMHANLLTEKLPSWWKEEIIFSEEQS